MFVGMRLKLAEHEETCDRLEISPALGTRAAGIMCNFHGSHTKLILDRTRYDVGGCGYR